jgi:hypothetical protein
MDRPIDCAHLAHLASSAVVPIRGSTASTNCVPVAPQRRRVALPRANDLEYVPAGALDRYSFDIDFHNGEGPVLSTATHAAVLVLHAGTVEEGDADVALQVQVASQRADGLPHEFGFEVPSGRLYIGDADDSDEIALQPGRWLLQFDVDDPADARHVGLVISPL